VALAAAVVEASEIPGPSRSGRRVPPLGAQAGAVVWPGGRGDSGLRSRRQVWYCGDLLIRRR
jgi:hypothetical protein